MEKHNYIEAKKDAFKRLNYHIQDMAENIIGFGVVKAQLEDLNIKKYNITNLN